MSESMIRIDARRDFTVLQNQMLRDKRLSLRTKGLFAVMLSRPGTWQFSVAGLSSFTGAGRDAVRSGLRELREAGYLTLEKQSHGEHGKFAGSVYILHEESVLPQPENPVTVEPEAPQPENPATAKPEAPQPGLPFTAEPPSGSPYTENPTQVNKDLSKDLNKIPPKSPRGDRRVRHELTEEARALLYSYAAGDRDLAEALAGFMEIRTAKKAVNSVRGIKTLLGELERLSGGDRETKLALIRQSITNSWKGLFPLRNGVLPAGTPAAPARVVENEKVKTW